MVYRPPKKKPAGPGFPANRPSSDPLEGPLSRTPNSEAGLEGDDRNLVVVDENYAGGDMEDRLWLFWKNQKGNIIRLATVACLGVIGWQGWVIYQKQADDKLQAEYQSLDGASALLSFAQSHPDNTFGKLALLEAADTYYKDGKFSDASKAYTQAATIWSSETYGQRARLGEALSLLQSGDANGGRQQLEALAQDTQAVENYRAEAGFDLAVLAFHAGDKATATKWLDKVKTFKNSQSWESQASGLQQIITTLGGTPDTSATPIKLTNTPSEAKPAAPAQTPASSASTASLNFSGLKAPASTAK